MKKMIKFPDIAQFRNVVRSVCLTASYIGKDDDGNPVYDGNLPVPTLTFTGTVKLHGTNAGVSYNMFDDLWVQSRNSIITPTCDNAGFAFFVESKKHVFQELFNRIVLEEHETATIYGEWCGQGIQKSTAVSQLPKMFVVIGVKISSVLEGVDSYWLSDNFVKELRSLEDNIYNILAFKKYEIEIDFNNPANVQNKLVEITNEVEECCPVGKWFGVEGVGEGVVWTHSSEEFGNLRFKVKGEKHSVSKVKKLASIDPEKLKNIEDFVVYAVTDNRLEQAIEQVFTVEGEEIDIVGMGKFLKWVMGDICKEELDTLAHNSLTPKDVAKQVSNKARKWFLNKWNSFSR